METLPPGKLRFIPLGGVGEIGKNIYVYQVLDQLLVVDCGLKFPDEKMFGVDIVVPDVRFLIENRHAIQAIVITHGHEDHIGGLGYILPELPGVPVYGPALALGLAKNRLGEKKLLDKILLKEYAADDVLRLGHFVVEPIRVSHSIPDSFALAIRTHAGTVIHTGDFKLDQTPVDGLLFDIPKLSRIADEGVLALVSDTTNVERPGYVPSERVVAQTFDQILRTAQGRVIIASFASQIHRMQMAVDSSQKYGRKIAAVGRSMQQNMDMAASLGYLSVPEGVRIRADEVANHKPQNVTILTTGSQGEPLAGLARMAAGDHRQVTIQPGDTIVLSSTPIPGNESAVWEIVNKLVAKGAKMIYDHLMPVHVSGHGYAEELKLVLNIANPQYVIPVHGEHRMLALYKKYAVEMGWLPEDVFVTEIGDVLELDETRGEIVDRVPCGASMIDNSSGVPIHEVVLRDRQFLADNGFVNIIVALDEATGEIVGGPEFMSRGFVYMDHSADLMAEAQTVVRTLLEDEGKEDEAPRELDVVQAEVKNTMRRFFEKRTGHRPVVIVTLLRV